MSDADNDRLKQIQVELTAILEERLGALNQILQTTESATRRIIAADVEMERHRLNQAKLEIEQTNIEAEVLDARERVSVVRTKNAEISAEADRLGAEIARRERDVRELDAEAERSRQRIVALEAEAITLREENASLRTKVKTLQENIVRMQRLKEELMSSVTGLAQQLRQASGTE
jgi:chromosome segregation ATPase